MRLRLRKDVMRLRPVAMYTEMLNAISASPKLVVAMLDACPPAERDVLAEALLALTS